MLSTKTVVTLLFPLQFTGYATYTYCLKEAEKDDVSDLAIGEIINRLPRMKPRKVFDCELWALLNESPQAEVGASARVWNC